LSQIDGTAELTWREIAQAAVRALLVIAAPPAFNDDLGLHPTGKGLCIQALIPQLAVDLT